MMSWVWFTQVQDLVQGFGCGHLGGEGDPRKHAERREERQAGRRQLQCAVSRFLEESWALSQGHPQKMAQHKPPEPLLPRSEEGGDSGTTPFTAQKLLPPSTVTCPRWG